MNWKKRISTLLLTLLLISAPLAPAMAVEDNTSSDQTAVQTTGSPSEEQPDTESQNENPDVEGSTEDTNTEDTEQDADDGEDEADAAEEDETPEESSEQSEEEEEPDLQPVITPEAKASICVNAETGTIVHEQNSREALYPASTTKVMTALLVLENCDDLDEIVTMQQSDFSDVLAGASSSGLLVDEEVTVETLLYCMLLPSGNEAANALARYIGGDVSSFVDLMNQRASSLGCVNTHFVNPNGLHDDEHYSCAYDLYLIAQAAMQYDEFQTIVNTARKTIPATNLQDERMILTTNELIFSEYSPIYYGNCYGIKTGHTTPAGYCLISYAKNDSVGLSYYSVVLGCEFNDSEGYAGSFVETKELFQWAFEKFRLRDATTAGKPVTERAVRLGKNADRVTLVTSKDVKVLIPTDADISMLEVDVEAQDSYDAPIVEGDQLGKVTYSYNGEKLASAELIALTSIERSQVLYYLDQLKIFVSSTPFKIVASIVVILFVLLFIIRAYYRRKRRKNRAHRRKKQK